MAKRRKLSKRAPKAAKSKTTSQTLMATAERTVLKQFAKILAASTRRYKQLVRQAAKATNSTHKKKYLAAALTAVVLAGVLATELRARIEKRPAPATRK